jgi:hypothetical protein
MVGAKMEIKDQGIRLNGDEISMVHFVVDSAMLGES